MPTRRHFRKYERWLLHRRTYIGASESPILLGYGYSGASELGLYAAKILGEDGEEGFSDDLLHKMRLALAVERGLMEMLGEQIGASIKTQGRTTYLHDEHEFIGATPDGLIAKAGAITSEPATQLPVEIKNVGQWQASEWEDDKTPVRFLIQLQHQIAVMGAPYGFIAANLANERLVYRKVPRDDELIGMMTAMMVDFWKRVQEQRPPDPDETEAARQAIHRLYPVADPELAVEFNESAIDLLAQRDRLKEQAKETEADLTGIDNHLKAALGEATYGILPNAQVVKWATVNYKAKECPHCGEELKAAYSARRLGITDKLPKQRLTYVQPTNSVPGITGPAIEPAAPAGDEPEPEPDQRPDGEAGHLHGPGEREADHAQPQHDPPNALPADQEGLPTDP